MNDCNGCVHDKTRNTRGGFTHCSQCDRAYVGSDRGFHPDKYEREELKDE